jgi:hypothetical protein
MERENEDIATRRDKRGIDMHVGGFAAKVRRFAVVMKTHFIPTIAQVGQGRCLAGVGTAGYDTRKAFYHSGWRQIFAQIADLTGKNA